MPAAIVVCYNKAAYLCPTTLQRHCNTRMKEIKGQDKSVSALLAASIYGIDYYQREYKWRRKQLQELVVDLTESFLSSYRTEDNTDAVENYGNYFLGSIIVSKSGGVRYIVDGQQRLTSLTLLLIYLNHRQGQENRVSIEHLIYSDNFGEKKFKLDVPDRFDCMQALLKSGNYNSEDGSESVSNLVHRYQDMAEIFPEELCGDALPHFIYWLINNVQLIEIIAYADDDAYRIFETMNDRGLSLTPTDMLKGYLLSNIKVAQRPTADSTFKHYLAELEECGEGTESDFFKAWLRSQYAQKIRVRKKDAKPEDFDLIGTEYHRWVRNNNEMIGLHSSEDYNRFIVRDLKYYAEQYIRLMKASEERDPVLPSVRYNNVSGFTLQYHALLAATNPGDSSNTATAKLAVVSDYLDCLLNLRSWNAISNSYSTMQYAIFILMRAIHGKSLGELRTILHKRLVNEMTELNFVEPQKLKHVNRNVIRHTLARIIDWIEQNSGTQGKFEEYIVRGGKNAYEIEHIWANHHDQHLEDCPQLEDFNDCRNMIGGLLLLPKKTNASFSDLPYQAKLQHYYRENPLSQSLHEQYYERNPSFRQLVIKYNLPFRHHPTFTKKDLIERSKLYSAMAKIIWSPDRLKQQD